MWAWIVLARVSRLVTDLRGADSVDAAWAGTQRLQLMVAEAVRHAVSPENIYFPPVDGQMIAVLERDGQQVEPERAPRGALVEVRGGRLGLVTEGGLIESYGEGLCIVPYTPGRWLRAWLVPEVTYFEGEKHA